MIRIILNQEPMPLKRPRFSQNGSKQVVYDSQSKLKRGLRILLRTQYQKKPIDTYCKVRLSFSFLSRDSLELWDIEKPTHNDLDNLVKFILDVGNSILWQDDRLITSIECVKKYSKTAFTIIEIIPMINIQEAELKVFKSISPAQLKEMSEDFNFMIPEIPEGKFETLLDWENEYKMKEIATGLIKFSSKWANTLKKISAIKNE